MNNIINEDVENIVSSGIKWDEFNQKTILITGANGLLASYMVYTLMKLNEKYNINCKVLALVRNETKAKIKFAEYMNNNQFELLVGDVSTININKKVNYIVHAASQASPIYYKTDPVGTINANVLGTNNMLNLALKNNVDSFLFFSSGEVYGDTKKIPTREEDFGYLDISNVRSCYGEGKRLGEVMCVSWYTQYNIPCKIVRPYHTYGPGLDFNDGRVFADFVSDIVNNRNIIMKSSGTATRAFCYISDAVIGFFLVLLNGRNGEAYNVGNDSGEISIINLARCLVELFPEKKLKIIQDETKKSLNYLKSTVKRSSPNIDKIKKLGWMPEVSIKDGFYTTILSFLN